MSNLLRTVVLAAALTSLSQACADEPQSLSATVQSTPFVSDDDGILLVPLKDTFTLEASSAGASSYPPPNTPVDHFWITCSAYTPGQPLRLDSKAFASNNCRVTFAKGTHSMGRDPDALYTLDKASPDNLFEITSAHAKVIEGRFNFSLTDAKGARVTISDGKFVAEDRQL